MKMVPFRTLLLLLVILAYSGGMYAQNLIRTEQSYDVRIPQENYKGCELTFNGLPLVGIFNRNILSLEPKHIFGWYLSVIIKYDDNKISSWLMPGNADVIKMQKFCDKLDKNLKNSRKHPNAVFLGRVTGEGYTQVMWYVNNPEPAHDYLQKLIKSNKYDFDFEYEMTQDKEWKEAYFWLGAQRE